MPPWDKYAATVVAAPPDPGVGGDDVPNPHGATLQQGPNRVQEAADRFKRGAGEAFSGAGERAVQAGMAGGPVGAAISVGSDEWNAVTRGLTRLIQPMFEPKTPDAVAEQVAVETNKKHGILDPHHAVTPEEKANLTVQIAAGLVPFERIAELGAGGRAAVDAARTQIAEKTGQLTAPEQKVGAALHKAIKRQGTTKDEVVANLRANPNRPAFHAAGDGFVPYAKAVVRTPGPGKTPIVAAIKEHGPIAKEQLKACVGELMGGDNTYFAKKEERIQARRDAARSGMEAIGDHPIMLDERSLAGLTSDAGKAAIARQAKILSMSDDPADRQVGSYLATLSERLEADPNAVAGMRVREVQDVSRTLIKAATSAYKRGEGDLGEELNNIGRTLRNNGKDPERGGNAQYGAWLKQYGVDSENLEAFELGYNAPPAGRKNTAESHQQTLEGMGSDAAHAHYKEGLGEGILYDIRNTGDAKAARDFVRKDELRDKVRLAVKDDAAFEQFSEKVGDWADTRERTNHVTSGSDTAGNLAGAADLDVQGMSNADKLRHGAEFVHKPFRKTAAVAMNKLADMLPEEKGLLSDPGTHDILGKALSDPKEMERLLNGAAPGAQGGAAARAAVPAAKPGVSGTAAMRAAAVAASGSPASPSGPSPSPSPASPALAPPSGDQSAPGDGPWSRYKPEAASNDSSPASGSEPRAFTSNPQMASYLQDQIGVPVKITSSYRDPEHNASVGGASGSAHTRGEAWDFVPQGMSMREAADALAASGVPFDQIEITPNHVHVSFDPRNRGQVIEG